MTGPDQQHGREWGRGLEELARIATSAIEKRFVLTITVVITVSLVGVGWQMNRMSENLVANTAVRDAAAYIQAIAEFRTLYTSEVVNRLPDSTPVAHDYRHRDGAIPLPATMTKLLGDRLGVSGSECNTRLYSDYPFPSRDEGGPRDQFERDALAALRADPLQPFHRLETINGEPVVRYATADLMRTSCIKCHNSHPDSPKTDWKEGDVRGVLAVTMPLRAAVADTRQGARATMAIVALFGGVVVSLFALILARLRREHRQYQVSNSKLIRKSQELSTATDKIERANSDLQQQAEDLTRSRKAALNLMHDMRLARDSAEAAARAKSQFLANMSHEIRTPLTAILGFAESLQDSVADKNLDAVQTIQRNGEHLLHVINDILDLSKIEAGRFQVERIKFSPHDLLLEVRELMQVRAEAKGLDWTVQLDGALPTEVVSDPTRTRQILLNLVGNAFKFTEIGSVHMLVKATPADDRLRLHLTIKDTGIGMAPEQLEQLFQPFMQADESMSRKFGGTGLGLTISKRFAELLGGDIRVESEPGRGSTFLVSLEVDAVDGAEWKEELCRSRESQDHASVSIHEKPLKGCRVLLVEDGPDNQRLIAFLLEKSGAEVVIAENGAEGRDAALGAEEPFTVVLMDMQMPVLDGYSATAQLRKAGYDRPIVALTAHAMAGDRQKCLAAGCDEFATKPIDRAKLIETIARFGTPMNEQVGSAIER